MELYLYWYIAAVVFLLIELTAPGLFIFLCFSVASFAAGLIEYYTDSINLPIITFIIMSGITFVITKKFAKKLQQDKNFKASNVDSLIGQEAVCTDQINDNKIGTVDIKSELWRASSTQTILKGELVKVVSISGNRVEVEKI